MQLWMLPAFEPAVELGHFSKLLVGGRVENLSQYLFSFFSLFFFCKAGEDLLDPPIPFSRSDPRIRDDGVRSRCPSALQHPP